ncbi:MAG: hypothetical protein QG574_3654, partial [Cyanobacteriota bacterium erpe_2018_sw_21hr_WHONDRS-SW48-000092_B_bin.40]|nr:hypothetical protein [Cyanobacteriota bacterium erpe_2018_sw_21hr_WHONDRS-SW48-000092_B_bin.40]
LVEIIWIDDIAETQFVIGGCDTNNRTLSGSAVNDVIEGSVDASLP